ncbi:hypothetical protein CC2G_001731 [Coprinopsis cinerea AmutBmut pab1-1]|nr:hypothetical protein CC2G_001731 [Coprinopsis cinerea AmutBmut pab1-1]
MVKVSTFALSSGALLASVAPYVVQAAPIQADDSVFERDFTHDIAEVFERQYYPMYAMTPPPVYYRPPAYGGYRPGPRLGGWASQRPSININKPTTKPSTTKPAAQPTTPANKPDNKPKTKKDSKKSKKTKRDFIDADFDIFERDFGRYLEGREFEFELEQREPIFGGLLSGVADIIGAAKGKKRQPAAE